MTNGLKIVLMAITIAVAAITGAASARLTVEARLTRLETQMEQVISILQEVRSDVRTNHDAIRHQTKEN